MTTGFWRMKDKVLLKRLQLPVHLYSRGEQERETCSSLRMLSETSPELPICNYLQLHGTPRCFWQVQTSSSTLILTVLRHH